MRPFSQDIASSASSTMILSEKLYSKFLNEIDHLIISMEDTCPPDLLKSRDTCSFAMSYTREHREEIIRSFEEQHTLETLDDYMKQIDLIQKTVMSIQFSLVFYQQSQPDFAENEIITECITLAKTILDIKGAIKAFSDSRECLSENTSIKDIELYLLEKKPKIKSTTLSDKDS